MKTAHTPGKWIIKRVVNSKRDSVKIIDQKTHTRIAEVQDAYHGSEYHANARLIAAAPELLEALEAAVAQLEEWRQVGYMKGWDLALHDAQDAITKARGER